MFKDDELHETRYCENCLELQQELQAKEQECEELKKINITPDNETWKTMSITFDNGFAKTEVADMSMAEYSQHKSENTKLKQTLAEIKEIAEIEIECKTYEIENDCFNETRCKALNEHIDFTKQILQKISECEVENEV